MKFSWERFNIYFVLLLAAVMAFGCQSSAERKRKKEMSVLRLHLEARPDSTDRTQPVPVFRADPVTIDIQRSAFLTEENVKEASVVETLGSFSIQLQLDRHGRLILEQITGGNRDKRIVIFAAFGLKKGGKPLHNRWIAAPKITRRISDGLLVFTPDATREEAELFVLGLNNAAKKFQDKE
ncbi:MAG TPA: hypothetical protein VN673_00385 [Clostridia bacterium]|nr:hypothetical protein [Clostridia bacterium]